MAAKTSIFFFNVSLQCLYRVLLVFKDSNGGREYGHHRDDVYSGSNGSEQGKDGFFRYIRAPQKVGEKMGTT